MTTAPARRQGPGQRVRRYLDQFLRPLYQQYRAYLPDNPHVQLFESRWRGYLRCVADRSCCWRTDLRVVDTVQRPGAPIRTLASFVVQDGRPGPQCV